MRSGTGRTGTAGIRNDAPARTSTVFTVTMSKNTSHATENPQTLVVTPPGKGPETFRVRKTRLLVISGPLQGRDYVVDREVFAIGSGAGNDLDLKDSTVSKRHCEISIDESGYRIRDLDSTNGTVVQGVRVRSASLNPGAEIQLGKTRIVFCPMPESQDVPLSSQEAFGAMLGRSIPMRRVFHLAETYAPTDATIMISGETGTGKEVLAEEIHRHSPRSKRPFIVIDCAALARDLIESELFGHAKGAFTGASADREGAFEHADGGTVFLDEIGDLSAELQPKLLRVLEKREIRRVGCNKVRPIDVRILCATNRRLDVEVNEGRFREDLFYRLSVVGLELPPLRHRRDDIPMLARKFLEELHGAEALDEIAEWDRAMEALKRHDWPGNVRELRNLIEVAFYGMRRPVDLTAFLGLGRLGGLSRRKGGLDAPPSADRPFKEAKSELIEEFERGYIEDLLRRNEGNVSKSAREAGIERAYLQRLIRKYDLRPAP